MSIAAPLGNLIFGPFLATFLLLCSLVTICQIISIPHAPIITLLEWCSQFWVWSVGQGSSSWLLYTTRPPFILSIFVLVMAFLIVAQWPRERMRCSLALCILLITASLTTHIVNRYHHNQKLIIRATPISIEQKQGGTEVTVSKQTARMGVNKATLIFNLQPAVVKATGSPQISNLILEQPTSAWCKALSQAVTQLKIKNLNVQLSYKKESPALARQLTALKSACLASDTKYAQKKKQRIPPTRRLTNKPASKRIPKII
ncbi:hypothetical protein HOL34_03345 [bacterium]|nr:hypothetical protein [bacterium]MBT6529114.1 hypothetical protein [bacterium]